MLRSSTKAKIFLMVLVTRWTVWVFPINPAEKRQVDDEKTPDLWADWCQEEQLLSCRSSWIMNLELRTCTSCNLTLNCRTAAGEPTGAENVRRSDVSLWTTGGKQRDKLRHKNKEAPPAPMLRGARFCWQGEVPSLDNGWRNTELNSVSDSLVP